jgi:hypothetical protein
MGKFAVVCVVFLALAHPEFVSIKAQSEPPDKIAIMQKLIDRFQRGKAKNHAEQEKEASAELRNLVLFREVGAIGGSVSLGHIVFSMNLSEIDSLFDVHDKMTQDLLQLFTNPAYAGRSNDEDIRRLDTHLTPEVKGWVKGIAAKSKDRMKEYKDQWDSYRRIFFANKRYQRSVGGTDSDTPHPRQKRFVGLILGAALLGGMAAGGFGLGVYNSVQLQQMKLSVDDQASKQFVIEKIQETAHRSAVLENDVKSLNHTQAWLVEKVIGLSQAKELLAIEMSLHDVESAIVQEVQQTMDGLDSLLQRSLSPSLVASNILADALKRLEHKAMKSGYALPVDDIAHVYQLSTSYLSEGDGVITIFLHVPMLVRSSILQLYELVSMPMALNNSVHSVLVKPESNHIAVNEEKDGFIIIRPEQLGACNKVGPLYLCSDTNYLLKDFESYCLGSLFMHRNEAATRKCPSVLVPARVAIRQTDRDEFYIFHPRTQLLTVECGKSVPERRHIFRGSQLVSLARGCRGYSVDYSIQSPEDQSLNVSIVTSTTHWKLGQVLHNVSLDLLDVLVPVPPEQELALEDIINQYWAIQQAQKFLPWRSDLNLGLSTTGILFCFALVVIGAYTARAFFCPARNGTAFTGNPAGAGRVVHLPGHDSVVYHAAPSLETLQTLEGDDPPAYNPSLSGSRRSLRSHRSLRGSYLSLLEAARSVTTPVIKRASPIVRRARDTIRKRVSFSGSRRHSDGGLSSASSAATIDGEPPRPTADVSSVRME